jgi:hypothetical protein
MVSILPSLALVPSFAPVPSLRFGFVSQGPIFSSFFPHTLVIEGLIAVIRHNLSTATVHYYLYYCTAYRFLASGF